MFDTQDWWLEAACWVRLAFLEQVSPLDIVSRLVIVMLMSVTYIQGHP
jgi:hypothetical protein